MSTLEKERVNSMMRKREKRAQARAAAGYVKSSNYPPAIYTYKLNGRVDEEMFNALAKQAEKQGITMGELFRLYLEWGLENDDA